MITTVLPDMCLSENSQVSLETKYGKAGNGTGVAFISEYRAQLLFMSRSRKVLTAKHGVYHGRE